MTPHYTTVQVSAVYGSTVYVSTMQYILLPMNGTGASMTSRAFLGSTGTKMPAHWKGLRRRRKAVVMAVMSPEAVW
jgi:hypothetical protein